MKIYYGIVDALGIESFIRHDKKPKPEMEKQLQLLKLRAQFNPHRNAVAYKIELPDADIKKIVDLMDKGLFVKAGQIITRYLDSGNGTRLTEINKHLFKKYKLRGYL